MQIVGLVISWAVAIGIIGIGIGYAAKSEMNATGFGLPQLPEREARGWWQVKGVRDIVSGILVNLRWITALPTAFERRLIPSPSAQDKAS